jgi:ATP-binding cassette subfamily B protein
MAHSIPQHIRAAFAAAGIDPLSLKQAAYAPLLEESISRDIYIAAGANTLYLLYGEETASADRKAKRLAFAFRVDRLEQYALDKAGELKAERLVSTARFWAEGLPEVHVTFFIGAYPQIDRFIKTATALSKGEEPEAQPPEDEVFCPRCGLRYPEEDRKICPKCVDSLSISKRLLGFFVGYLPRLAAVLAAMVAGTLFQIFSPYIGTRVFFDEVLTDFDPATGLGGRFFGMVLAVVLLVFAVRVVGQALGILYSYLLASVMPYIILDLKMKIFEAMQRLSVGYYTSKHTGALMNRVNKDADRIYWFFVDGFPFCIINGMLMVGVVAVMFVMDWLLALIAIGLVPLVVLIFRMMWPVFMRLHHRQWATDARMTSFVSDAIAGSRVIKAFAREEDEIKRFEGIGEKLRRADVSLTNTEYTTFPLVYLLMYLSQVTVIAVGGIMVVNGRITLGTLLTFIAYIHMLQHPLEFMSWVSNWWSRCVDAAHRVFEIVDARSDVMESENPIGKEALDGHIELNGVHFEYEPARPIIKGLNLTVEAGHMLGIVGKTGAGKTTLANLIARLYDATTGEVKLDGINVKDLPLSAIRGSVGLVSQEIYLFIGNIADNIRYANPNATMEEVIAAAKAAHAHDFIMKLPDAYETRVGAGGQDLSGGERQRLSIARTIIQNPKILILDEATAAMDTETEMNIQEALAKLQTGRTTIAIAHRMSTLRDADRLAVVHEGKVVETGTHDELMKLKGEYHKLYMIQMEALKTIRMEG